MIDGPGVDVVAARAAVAESAARVTGLIRSAGRTGAPAVGQWDLTDVAVHMSHGIDVVLATARGGGSVLGDISGLSSMTRSLVVGETTRDLAQVADRIDASVAELLAFTGVGTDLHELRPWLVSGVELPVSALVCHALNELTVHGRDIARAEGRAWPVNGAHCAMVLDGFLFPVLGGLGGSMLDHEAADEVRARIAIHVRGGRGAVMDIRDGNLSVESLPGGRVDCHLSVDPTAFLLLAWGRIGQWPAIARGKLLAWGRKPWVGIKLKSWVRTL
jgi:hypothetical protein